jgi:hypothetical protein
MEKQEQLNELESRQLDTQARMNAVLPAVIDYVTGLTGFKNKYPEEAAAYAAAKQEDAAIDDEAVELKKDWIFHIGEAVKAGDEITYNGKVYEVLQDHVLQADWVPDQVPALYRLKGDPGEEWPEFVQPTGSHDAYKKGDKVTYKGEHYVSLIDANVWAPDAYPQGWEKQP